MARIKRELESGTDDAFSTGTVLESAGFAGPIHCLWELGSSANKKQKGSTGARPLPLRCLSQFFPGEEKINCLGNELSVRKSVYLSLMR